MSLTEKFKRWATIEHALNMLYTLNKLMVVIAGAYIIFWPPFTWVGTLSSTVMVIAAMISIWAIWTKAYTAEFVTLWFVASGVGAFVGYQLVGLIHGDRNVAQAAVASMALILLVARGLSLYRLVKQILNVERLIEENGD